MVLRDGDKIFVGQTILKFTFEDDVDVESGALVDRFLFEDDLTGLVVKRRFYNELGIRLEIAKSSGSALAVLMMDMDGLKSVNDRHGHSFGAFVISEAGKRIGAICNPLGQACRYGGDEFIAYLTDHDVAAALGIGEAICEVVRGTPFVKDGVELKLSISIGVAAFPDGGNTVEILNRAADEALYRAKDKGRNQVSG
jgi:diguanylate cyclase (GGDEF)-like protein